MVRVEQGQRPFLSAVDWLKETVRTSIKAGVTGHDELQLLLALTLGEKSGIGQELLQDFRTLGIIHLIVISGLHVAVVAGVCWWIAIFCGAAFSLFIGQRDVRFFAAVISLITIWFFIALTGFGTPAVRAGLIVTLYLGSVLLGRTHDPWDSLALAAILILLMNPSALFGVSFQLTFVAVAGILISSRYFIKQDRSWPLCLKLLRVVANMVIISLGAAAAVLPLLAYHFGQISTVGPILNIIFSPMVTLVIVPVGLVGVIVAPISTSAAAVIFKVVAIPVRLFVLISKYCANYLYWTFLECNISLVGILALYGLGFLFIYWRQVYKRRLVAVPLLAAMALGFVMVKTVNSDQGKLVVTFLDVGQGASVVVQKPDGGVTIIDGGGVKGSSLDIGERVISPFLRESDIKKVDRIIVTHPHPDHFLGLGYIAEHFNSDIMLIGNYPEDDLADEYLDEWGRFLDRVETAGVKVKKIVPGSLEDGAVKIIILSPLADIPGDWNTNDASLIIKIMYGDISFLITADIEGAAERYLSNNLHNLKSSVLQIPHHGSSTSSSKEFLDAVSPKYGVIQVGAFNKYGFPNEDVLRRLQENNILTFRTDTDGAVKFISDGKTLDVSTGARN
jgi:competence protein ComEC